MINLHQGSSGLPSSTARPDPTTGSFVINDIIPGEYQFQARMIEERPASTPEFRPLPSPDLLFQDSATGGFYVKSARLGQTDVTNGLTIAEGTQDRLEIVLSRGSGSLEGIVTEPGRNGAAGSTVVLVPAVGRKNSSRDKSTVADGSGRFRFQSIPPGDYLVFAWNDVETGAWQDPEFLRPYEARGHRIQVSGSSKQDIQLSVISN